MANSLISVQIIPKTEKYEDVIPFVDAAIKVIDESGVKYEVHPLETTMEGEISELMNIITKMNEKMVELGCVNVITQVKILYQPSGITMDTLTEKYRS
ncbi:thiamine-binding protein [Rummeliibacillus pycnus]|uniref:thiamine-binding protein n=1 Tax=Rummeliibacillus pycnus TaxID=101070 RepID=UPI000C9C4380|nr:thiamine-binding protein [Rummeliibacillus pycnus]